MGTAARQYVEHSNPLRAILDRPFHYTGEATGCACKGCRAQRARPFSCVGCGYAGEPVTFPCDCRRNWKEAVAFLRDALANPERLAALGLSRSKAERGLAERLVEEPTTICESGTGDCCHTTPECPVCRHFLTHNNAAPEVRHVFAMLRDVRVALTERGLV